MLQDQILNMEDRVDKLNADFSDQSKQAIDIQEEISSLETDVAKTTKLTNESSGAERQGHVTSLKEATEKLKTLRNDLITVNTQKSTTSEMLEKCQNELFEKQSQLNSGSRSGKEPTKSSKGGKKK